MENDDKTALLLIIGRQAVRISVLEAQNAMLQRMIPKPQAPKPTPAANEDAEG